jgi:hypothetical protein
VILFLLVRSGFEDCGFALDELVRLDAFRIVGVDAAAARAADARACASRPARFRGGICRIVDPDRAVRAALRSPAAADSTAAAALMNRILIRRDRGTRRLDHIARAFDGSVYSSVGITPTIRMSLSICIIVWISRHALAGCNWHSDG